MKQLFLCLCFYVLLATPQNLLANNITIIDLELKNPTSTQVIIEFDVAWDNSWRTNTNESNYDAAWIFLKVKSPCTDGWQHLSSDGLDGTQPSNAFISRSANGEGIMVYRDADGIGNVAFKNIRLRWNFDADGIDDYTLAEIAVHAIEMVYIPEGKFWLGDGSVTDIRAHFEAGNTGQPFQITSENAITLGGTNSNNLSNHNRINGSQLDDFDYNTTKTLPAAYPKGYNAFYIMKYELSEGQMAAFFNEISAAAATTLYPSADATLFGVKDDGIYPNKYYTNTPTRACGFITKEMAAAYLDWATMRALTEFEWTKAARGPLYPVADEYAWGNNGIMQTGFTLSNVGTAQEVITNPSTTTGNAYKMPTNDSAIAFRCGIFSSSAVTKSRVQTGASYYGVMEMTGNVSERFISIKNNNDRAFDGSHGDGIVDVFDTSISSRFSLPTSGDLRLSNRSHILANNTGRWGIRGALSASFFD